MSATTREQNRSELTDRIMVAARRQLAEEGAAGVSLRSVAREVGMVSSAVYRYVANRDELLTRLIVEAYDSLGDAAEHAADQHAHAGDLDRWIAAGSAVRTWALTNPHEYLLLYGSPVPGYAAPADTVGPGTRVVLALVGVVRVAIASGRLEPPQAPYDIVGTELSRELAALGEIAAIDAPPSVVLATLIGWTQMYGLISFELTNQTRGMVDHDDELFVACVAQTGRSIGLR